MGRGADRGMKSTEREGCLRCKVHGIAGVSGSTEIVMVIKIVSKSVTTFLQVVKTSRRRMDNMEVRSTKYHLYLKGSGFRL